MRISISFSRYVCLLALTLSALLAGGCTKPKIEGTAAGHPIRVSWSPNPVSGGQASSLKIELNGAASTAQTASVTYDNPGVLYAAPTSAAFAVGQQTRALSVSTKPTTSAKYVTATASLGGVSISSGQLVINPAHAAGTAAETEVVAAAMVSGEAFPDTKKPKEPQGHPIRVSFEPDHDLSPGGTTTLFVGLDQTVTNEGGQPMTITFDNAGFGLLTKPRERVYPVTVPYNADGVGIEIAAGANEGLVKITIESGGGSIKTHVCIVNQQ